MTKPDAIIKQGAPISDIRRAPVNHDADTAPAHFQQKLFLARPRLLVLTVCQVRGRHQLGRNAARLMRGKLMAFFRGP